MELRLLEVELRLVEDHLDRVHVVLVGRVEYVVDLEFLVAGLGFEGVMSSQVVHEHGEGLLTHLLTELLAEFDEPPSVN